MPQEFSAGYDENKKYLDKLMNIKDSFDVGHREAIIGGKQACFYFITSFCQNDLMERIMKYLVDIPEKEMPKTASDFMKKCVPYGSTSLVQDSQSFLKSVLSGETAILIEGYTEILVIDNRTYPARGVAEPDQDRSMRGSRDGFVETVLFNTALIRRRIRDPKLTMEIHTVGTSSRTDVVICYMKGKVEEKILADIRKKIDSIEVESLTMNQQSLAECLYQHKWYNPFPKFKFSERPDTTAACILEGNIAILVDNSPSVMILPTSVFDLVEDSDDYYFPPVTGTYLRLSRYAVNIFALLISPIFLLFTKNPSWLPDIFQFILIKEEIIIPVIVQFLILEFALDGLRIASQNTPTMFSTPLSILAGIVLGQYSVESGWFNSQVMLYMAFVALSNYSQTSLEIGYAIKFMRIILLLLTGFLDYWGFGIGIIFILFCLFKNKTIAGKSYLYPLIPFDKKQFKKRFLRISLLKNEGKG